MDEANEKSKRALEKHQGGFTALKETFIRASLEVEAIEKEIEEAEQRVESLDGDIEQKKSWLGIPRRVQYPDVVENKP